MFYPSESDYKLAEYSKPFIYKAFNYFNGKVNVINSNVSLRFFESYTTDGIMAETKWPSIVIINPINSIIHSKEIAFSNGIDIKTLNEDFIELNKSLLCGYIIHELFHCDQIIDFNKLDNNNEGLINDYNVRIEKDVYAMSYLYMQKNMSVISRDLNTGIYLVKNNGLYSDINVPYYKRLTHRDFYIQFLSKFSNILISDILESEPNIKLAIIEDSIYNLFWIKHNNIFIEEAIPYISKIITNIALAKNWYVYDCTKKDHEAITLTLELTEPTFIPASLMQIDEEN